MILQILSLRMYGAGADFNPAGTEQSYPTRPGAGIGSGLM